MTPPTPEAIAAADIEITRWLAQSLDAGPIGRSVQDAIDAATEALRKELDEEKAMLDWLATFTSVVAYKHGAKCFDSFGKSLRGTLREAMKEV